MPLLWPAADDWPLVDEEPEAPGCRFHTRCWMAKAICKEIEPAFEQKARGHWAACHFAGEF